ncbi:MAG TPA: SDR family oxidoreductase, partial [Rhodoglobus sp.]|nr:SDR family oxidoreductase [Rhodoglobus sp.]
ASSGIGRATAIAFAGAGHRVVLTARNREALDAAVDECIRAGGEAMAVTGDVTDPEAMHSVAAAAVDRFGRLDVWVNNAGVSVFGEFLDVPLEEFRRVIDVDLWGTVHGARAALQVMRRQHHGVLVNVASIVGEIPQPYTSAYGMAKAAVRALGVSLRSELALAGEKRIRVSTVLPPTVDTPFFAQTANHTGRRVLALPPVYPPELVAATIVRAATAPKAELVIGVLGRALVRLHRISPRLIEGQMALQTEYTHLSKRQPGPTTSGNLFEPGGDSGVTGGWNGAARMERRKWAAVAIAVAGAAALVARRALPRR